MANRGPVAKKGGSRVWIIEGRAGPANAPVYFPDMKGGAHSQNFGDVTRIQAPDPDAYNRFVTVGEFQGEEERATIPLVGLLSLAELSTLARLAKQKCSVDVLIHMGECRAPSVFNSGFEKTRYYSDARISTYDTDEIGALNSGEQGQVNETAAMSADRMDEIKHLRLSETGGAANTATITGITFCDQSSCGECGVRSDGCQHIFATSTSSVASPTGFNAVIYSQDGGATWGEQVVMNWPAAADIDGIACVGDYLVIFSVNQLQLAYITKAAFLAAPSGGIVWTTVTLAKAPNDMYSQSASMTWIAADDGYVFLVRDPSVTPETKSSGGATSEDLQAIHAVDEWNVLAVGTNNTVIYSTDAGESWTPVTGPAAGVTLQACWMLSDQTWFVATATGHLYYTLDRGANWTEKTFIGYGGSSSIWGIKFDKQVPSVGYMLHYTGAAGGGRILRTIDGGYSWVVLPGQGGGIMPSSNNIYAIDTCGPNLFFAGGAQPGPDGILIKGSAA